MATTEHIHDYEKIEQIGELLKAQRSPRNYLLWTLAVNTGLRAGDLLHLRCRDIIRDRAGHVRKCLTVKTRKTKKTVKPGLNKSCQSAIEHWQAYHRRRYGCLPRLDAWLFTRQDNALNGKPVRPMTRVGMYKLVRKWCRKVDCQEEIIGCHSLRKSWGYHSRQRGMPLELIMHNLGHESISTTKQYLGITDEECQGWMEKINL